jgi:hypothetical protein
MPCAPCCPLALRYDRARFQKTKKKIRSEAEPANDLAAAAAWLGPNSNLETQSPRQQAKPGANAGLLFWSGLLFAKHAPDEIGDGDEKVSQRDPVDGAQPTH